MLTTAVAEVTKPDGTHERLVGSSRRTLNPAQRDSLRPGETPISGPGHAEMKVLNAARLRGYTVKAVASTRTVCAGCRKAIESAGAKVYEP